jgi:NitT/TauT family transport system permease protein/sulfonate transport system permease protein
MSMIAVVRSRASGILLLAAILVLWQVAATSWIESPNLPAVTAIAQSLRAGLESGELLQVLAATLWVMALGYFIGVTCAVLIGLVMANVRAVRALLDPILELLRPIPIPAIVPPLILLLGIDEGLKIFVVGFSSFFPVVVNTMGGARAVDPIAIDVGRTLRVGRLRIVRSIVMPASLPYILAGMRTSLALALVTTVTAELIAGSAGIGYYLMMTQYAMRTSEMYAAIFLLALTGYVLNQLFLAAERRVLHWHRAKPL